MSWWNYRYDDRGFPITGKIALERWDAGDSIWSVEMGGLGPGYEQAIQILAVECLRKLYEVGFNWRDPEETFDQAHVRAVRLLEPVADRFSKPCLGFSGAQVGAAMNVATMLHRRGYREALQDPVVKDRLIQISRRWPRYPEDTDGIPEVPGVQEADGSRPLPIEA